MDTDPVLDQLRPMICDVLGVEPAACTPQTRLVADLGAESIDLVDLTFRLEKAFHLTIPEGELFEDASHPRRDWTLAEIADYIRRRSNPPGHAPT